MSKSRSAVITAVITAAVVLLNAIVFYSVYCTGDILQSMDIYGGEYTFTRSDIDKQSGIISALPEDKSEAVLYIEERIEILRDYSIAAGYIADNGNSYSQWNDLSPDEQREKAEQLYSQYTSAMTNPDPKAVADTINADIRLYQDILQKVSYSADYDEYINEVLANSQALAQISIYQDNAFLMNNITRTRKDFYGLGGLDISVVSDAGAMTFINCRFTDIFALFLILLTIVLVFIGDREQAESVLYRRQSVLLPIAILSLGIAAMYLCNYLITVRSVSEIPTGVLIQSVTPFRGCPYVITLGAFTILSVLMKMLGCAVVFALVTLVTTSHGKKQIILSAAVGGFALFELLTAFSGAENATAAFLREINLVSFFTFERFFIRYLNLNIASLAVSRLPLFFIFAAVLMLASFTAANKGLAKNAQRLVSQAERGYYDEINRRYTESRKIRHDIANHLLAISALIESGKTDEARRYIGEVSEANDLAAMPVKTGASVLDALLYKKTEQAKESGITLRIEVNCPLGDTSVSNYDLCSVFGNILDNALEAVQPLEDDRKIDVLIEKQLDMLYISCENPFSGEIRTRGERILTAKSDASLHGYGIGRVKDIAHKHGGDVKITAEKGVFLIEILMNM